MTNKRPLSWATTVILVMVIGWVLVGMIGSGQATAVGNSAPEANRRTASLQHFSLDEMVDNADKIFRGTVVDFDPGKVAAGGAELPAVTYRLRVEQNFKGEFAGKDGVQFAEITMLGDVKEAATQGNLQQFSALPTPPLLRVGSDYLLLTTAESAIGLSTTVGLGQGSFEIFSLDKQEWALNEYNNAGLFDGPVAYDDLAAEIQQQVGE